MVPQDMYKALLLSVVAVASLSSLTVPEALAIENYAGSVVGRCEELDGITYNVVATTTAPNWFPSTLEYRFTPAPALLDFFDVDGKTRYYLVTPGTYTVDVGNPGFVVSGNGYQASYTFVAPNCSEGPCAPPPLDLVGWWPLDEPSGSSAVDLAGRHNGSLLGAPSPGPGRVAGALAFDGNDELRVADPTSAPLLDFGAAPGGDFSIDFWLNTSDNLGIRSILDKRENPGPRGYAVFLGDGRLALQLAEGGSGFCDSSTANGCTNYDSTVMVADGQWHFVAITVDRDQADGIRWYLDGVEVGTRRNPLLRGDSLANSAPLRIGAHAFNGPDFTGTLDEIEIFNGVLQPTEIADLFAAASSGKCKPTYWGPVGVGLCVAEEAKDLRPVICNNSSELSGVSLGFKSCPGSSVLFSLGEPEPILLPPHSCRSVNLTVRALSLGALRRGCFDVSATDQATGQQSLHRTNLYESFLCADPVDANAVGFPVGDFHMRRFRLHNPGPSPFALSYEIASSSAAVTGAPIRLNGGELGAPVTGQVTVPARGDAEVAVEVELGAFQPLAISDVSLKDTASGDVLASFGARSLVAGCEPSPTALCLNDGRFQVSAVWRDFRGRTGLGQAVPLTNDTGYFWFFNSANVELVLKVLDGTPINNFYWVFYGALSTVEYVITVTDTETGASKTYVNPARNLASVADTQALPGAPTSAQVALENQAARGELFVPAPRVEEAPEPLLLGSCVPSATHLCLNGNRFQVEVTWKIINGTTGSGTAVPLTSDTGYFWFFNVANVELVIKVLDGRPVNGKWWVFYGALSNVEYTIKVTDTETGAVKTYVNPQGTLGSRADTSAF